MKPIAAGPAVPARAMFFLVLTTLFWGGSFVANKLAFREVPPLVFFTWRFLGATLVMALLCSGRWRRFTPAVLRSGIPVGLALAATNLTFVLGVYGTSVSRAGFLNNLFVLFIPLACFLIWRERLGTPLLTGVGLAVVGLWQLAAGAPQGLSRGDLLSTVCAGFITLHLILVSRLLGDEDVWLVSLVQFATVALVGGCLWLLLPWPAFTTGRTGWLALGYCIVFPTVVCFTLQNTYQRFVTPARAGLIYTLDPVWSLLGGVLLLGERLTPREWVGCVLILAAVLVPAAARFWQERGVAPVTPQAGEV